MLTWIIGRVKYTVRAVMTVIALSMLTSTYRRATLLVTLKSV